MYGSNTARALLNFPIKDRCLADEMQLVRALGEIKQACALANRSLGALRPEIADAVIAATGDMIDGKLNAHFSSRDTGRFRRNLDQHECERGAGKLQPDKTGL